MSLRARMLSACGLFLRISAIERHFEALAQFCAPLAIDFYALGMIFSALA
ncbi:hypothetical protein C772_00776 [Bhargavaea cecembensis DSE10]|uniref:Uncharacterized protein n=1 Tax=Bhargavaea cecembensis DSE10 TaxID=1235279 RepID=M7NJ07_9BACL|nr:hypothetical protein C772_00776 [Bhargavaea cecembensis DSE10]